MSKNTTFFEQVLDEYADLADVATLNDFFELLDDQHKTIPKHFESEVESSNDEVVYKLTPIGGMVLPNYMPDGYTVSFVHDEYHDSSENIFIEIEGLPKKQITGNGAIMANQLYFAVYREFSDSFMVTLENSENRLFVDQVGHGFETGDLVGNDGTGYVLADITDVDDYTLADGVVVGRTDDTFLIAKAGVYAYKNFNYFLDEDGNQLLDNNVYYLSSTNPGKVTLTEPDTSIQIKQTVCSVDSSNETGRRLNILTNNEAFYGVQPMQEFIQDANTLNGLGSADFVQVKTETTYTDAVIIGDKLRQLDGNLNGNLVTQDRKINTGDGLIGGGDLSNDLTIDLKLEDNSLLKSSSGLKVNGAALIDTFYPVGSIYISTVSTNPSVFMGGSWERFGQGKTLVGVDETDLDFSTPEKTGGSKAVTLTTAQIPIHGHEVTGKTVTAGSHGHTATTSTTVSNHNHTANHNHSASTGSSGSHKHLTSGESEGKNNYGQTGANNHWGSGSTDSDNPLAYTSTTGSHTHTVTVATRSLTTSTASINAYSSTAISANGSHEHDIEIESATTGEGKSHTNLQPYITTYMFKRIS